MDPAVIKRVGRVLFNEQGDELLSQAMWCMLYGQPNCVEPGGFDYEAVLKLCLKSTSPLSVAKVIAAGVAVSPKHAQFWLGEIKHLFVRSGLSNTVVLIDIATPAFVFGLALGLFQAQNWLDEQWPLYTDFEKQLPDALVNLAFNFHPITELALDNPQNAEYPSKQYEAAFSQAVKAWARPKANVGRRIAQVYQLFDRAYAVIERLDKKDVLPKLSSLILDQVCYAHFGSISTLGRVQALYLMHRQTLDMAAKS